MSSLTKAILCFSQKAQVNKDSSNLIWIQNSVKTFFKIDGGEITFCLSYSFTKNVYVLAKLKNLSGNIFQPKKKL